MSTIIAFALFVLLPLSTVGCATAIWPAKVYHNPTYSLGSYRTFSFNLSVTANVLEDKGRERIIKLLGKSGYKYVEDKETADFIVEERTQWEERIGYTPQRVEYTPVRTQTAIIYIPSYTPERPYIYYDFSADLTFYDRVSRAKIYEANTAGTTSFLDMGEIYQDLIRQGNLPVAGVGATPSGTAGATGPPQAKASYKVYTTRYSKIYHRAGCPALGAEPQRYSPGAPPPGLGAEELVEFKSPEEASTAGASACQRCKP